MAVENMQCANKMPSQKVASEQLIDERNHDRNNKTDTMNQLSPPQQQ